MELVDFLHVPEDDELFVHDAGGDLLHPAGHFPQVGLPGGTQGLDKLTPNCQETVFLTSVNTYPEFMCT